MKQNLALIIGVLIMGNSCREEMPQIEQHQCVEMAQSPDWDFQDFKVVYNSKTDYTIQFPDNYTGPGMRGFEGFTFFMNRDDDGIVFEYAYCKFAQCYPFGLQLEGPIPDYTIYEDGIGNETVLNIRKDYCKNDTIVGILYHTAGANALGDYYMRQGEDFLEGLTVRFDESEYDEVESIIKTITMK